MVSYKNILSIIILTTSTNLALGQLDENSDLFKVLKEKDSLLFELGYNQVDTAQVAELVNEDFEFYHDKGGAIYSKLEMVNSMAALGEMSYKATRELVPQSLKVYPLRRNNDLYAALQTGQHRFWAKYEGREKFISSTAKFTTLWILLEGKWVMKRVFSYDHQAPDNTKN